ncbi:hypothetical protein C9374_005035 [Naegleria lovaniensis]|uniref:Uncharacterized protein n=1 Tax=Naegleria lovaniensis TaxID=51637 RepID=A0AA88GQX8_NAELO|nr:uncharacterized protein C9374_005035 [Naegleria lovaniensis]KAG2382455.1 hypothetical protein C9374_005035 [Naegleria lovaniensis]
MQKHLRLNVRVIVDGFSLSVPSPSTTDLNSSLSISLLEKVNPFYRKLHLDNSNRSSSLQLSNPRNLRCIVSEQASLNDIKQTICKQYQMVFYERSDDSTPFEDTTFFTISRIYNERGIEMGLWNSHLKCSDIFNDEQVIYVKLDCVRRNGLKLKDQYMEVSLWLSPEKENVMNHRNEKDASPSNMMDYETPKKRKTVESTPGSKKQKLTSPISTSVTKTAATSQTSTTLETSQLSSDSEHDDSVASNSEDERDIISPEVTPKKKIVTRQTTLKTTSTSAPTTRKQAVKTEAIKTRSKIKQEEQKKPIKKQTESIYISDEATEEEEEPVTDKEEEQEQQEENTTKEDESEEESEEEENEDMTAEQYAKYYANLKPWLKQNMVNGKFKNDSQYQKFRDSFKLLSPNHQAEILEYIKELKGVH